MPMSSSKATKQSTKKPRPKTKTFTGCWTCRSRKVKCDSGRPRCSRCMNAGLHCQGYDIRLHWLYHDDPTPSANIKRQAMSLLGKIAAVLTAFEMYTSRKVLTPGSAEDTPWARSTEEIDQFIDDIDQTGSDLDSKTVCAGPFAIFSVPNYTPKKHRQISREASQTQTQLATFTHQPPSPYGSLATGASPGSPELLSEPAEELPPADTPTSSSSDPVFSINDSWHYTFDTDDSLIVKTSRDSLIGSLIHHYVYVVANVLQPMIHPQNTYTSIYVPSAMSTFEVMSSYSGGNSIAPSHVALLFSILSSSAFHLRGHHDDTVHADGLARYCRSTALSQLQLSLTDLPHADVSDEQDIRGTMTAKLETILAVMLTLVTADVVDGPMSEFWIHLAATRQISQRLKQRSQPGSRSERLISISSFLTIISNTTDYTRDPIPWAGDISTDECLFGDSHGLEFTYGVTATLANLIHRTTQLARHMSYYFSNNDSPPDSLITAAEELLEELLAWDIADENLHAFDSCDDVTILIARKHMLAFAQGVRLYYHTTVLPCTLSEMTACTKEVAAALREIETIKEKTGYNTVRTATISWPGFIASCEALPEDREVWTGWWTSMLSYRIGNMNDLWSVVRESWKLRDQGINETPAWAPVLRRGGKRILAI